MKIRIISGAVFTLIILTVVFLLPPIALTVFMSMVSVIAVWEIFRVAGMSGYRPLLAISIVFAGAAPFFLLPATLVAGGIVFLVYTTLTVFITVNRHMSVALDKAGLLYAVSLMVSLSFSCVAYLRQRPLHGLFYIILIFIITWMSDSGAYFTGTFFGKHKLCPVISPKKTVEGLIGGIAAAVVFSLLAALIYQSVAMDHATEGISFWQTSLVALLCAPVSVMGDLFASVFKRHCGAKDYGNIMPGHGGVMDRFDSLIMSAPVLFLIVYYWPLIYKL